MYQGRHSGDKLREGVIKSGRCYKIGKMFNRTGKVFNKTKQLLNTIKEGVMVYNSF